MPKSQERVLLEDAIRITGVPVETVTSMMIMTPPDHPCPVMSLLFDRGADHQLPAVYQLETSVAEQLVEALELKRIKDKRAKPARRPNVFFSSREPDGVE